MNIEYFREYCLSKRGVTEETPFGPDTLVFKVMNKMFALADIQLFESVNLKCDPDKAVRLRDQFNAVAAGYHMNKKHWNTIFMDGSIKDLLILEWIDDSYELVKKGLRKSEKEELSRL